MSILGDESSNDLLTVILDKLETEKVYLQVWDITNQITYLGWLESASGYGDYREIVLSNSETYSFDEKLISKAPRSYIALRKENFWIEFKPKMEVTE